MRKLQLPRLSRAALACCEAIAPTRATSAALLCAKADRDEN